MVFASKRAFLRARRSYVRPRLRYRSFEPLAILISPSETRDELILRAHRVLERLRMKRHHPAHPYSASECREALREATALRTEAARRPRVDASDRAFYASIRSGARHGLLYGPFPTQIAALRALPIARSAALELNASDAAFASFGTASLPASDARPGLLNAYLPPIGAAADAAA